MKARVDFLNPTTYYTDAYGVYRWDQLMCPRPGTYRVVLSGSSYELVMMAAKNWEHPTCVVDDFGQLQRVPA